ncbi:cytochrome c biogenesis protein CcdA [Paenibacillus glycinis]|uniref:Cytochrome c biogenesis protein CcdA n=1 Tax=Paenibacillus glycinis TaxID=2697035 RepID=A0ABW9XWL4_9BACL|nr:cytochrome c biogenesis protein CcdA [Paenibacillus glycinis]NBD27103.1 cytochrome c biogenesis protein CcdA [Paenibacillus glycinis]
MDILLAFSAGLLSFLSPCVLPLIPVYLSHLVGASLPELQSSQAKLNVLIKAGFFVLGFSAVFMLLGVSVSSVGRLLATNSTLVKQIGGGLIIVFGLHTTGIFKIKAFYAEKRLFQTGARRERTAIGSLLLGMAFAAGWTPCVGPILSSILIYAGSMSTIGKGVLLLAAYSLGLALPLLLAAFLVGNLTNYLKKITRHLPAISVASGIVMIAMGLLVFTDKLAFISQSAGLFNL